MEVTWVGWCPWQCPAGSWVWQWWGAFQACVLSPYMDLVGQVSVAIVEWGRGHPCENCNREGIEWCKKYRDKPQQDGFILDPCSCCTAMNRGKELKAWRRYDGTWLVAAVIVISPLPISATQTYIHHPHNGNMWPFFLSLTQLSCTIPTSCDNTSFPRHSVTQSQWAARYCWCPALFILQIFFLIRGMSSLSSLCFRKTKEPQS